VKKSGLLLVVVAAVNSLDAADKNVLMLTKSSAFQHSVVARGKAGELGLAEQVVKKICEDNGYKFTVTKDAAELNADNLKKYQALFFYTQGDLTIPGLDKAKPMKKEDRPALLEFVKNGGAFIGTHCGGADTFNHNFWVEGGAKPFCEMVGAEFISHGAQQNALVEVVDPNFPAVKHYPQSFKRWDEWYAYKGFHKNMHVLMMLKTAGMDGNDYARPEYPITWCSNYGKGKVFYTGMGHVEEMWHAPDYVQMLTVALKWGLGEVEGDARPNLGKLFGGDEAKVLERFNTVGKRVVPPPKKAKKPAVSK
jgi:hypothetical protein